LNHSVVWGNNLERLILFAEKLDLLIQTKGEKKVMEGMAQTINRYQVCIKTLQITYLGGNRWYTRICGYYSKQKLPMGVNYISKNA